MKMALFQALFQSLEQRRCCKVNKDYRVYATTSSGKKKTLKRD